MCTQKPKDNYGLLSINLGFQEILTSLYRWSYTIKLMNGNPEQIIVIRPYPDWRSSYVCALISVEVRVCGILNELQFHPL